MPKEFEMMVYPIYYEDLKKTFYAIWPKTSETFKNQGERSIFPKYTVIVKVLPENSELLLEKIEEIKKNCGHNFRQTPYLHFTFLGLNGIDQKPIDPTDVTIVKDEVEKFLDGEKIGPLTINFKLIRPGAWYYKKPNETEPRDLVSDGTVVCMADKDQTDAKKFLKGSNDLAKYLREKLPDILDDSLKRAHQTIWCTLGYFDEDDDFLITKELHQSFTAVRNIKMSVKIDRLGLIKFRWKSLVNNHEIASFQL